MSERNQQLQNLTKLFVFYTILVIIYNTIFTSVYLGDIESLVALAKLDQINEWQMLGGYLLGKFAILFSDPKTGLYISNILFWILSLVLFHHILSRYIRSTKVIISICLISPLFIFSNIIYKESFPIFFFLLAFTSIGWISPIFNSVLRINLFIETILIYISLNYKTSTKFILTSIVISFGIFYFQTTLYTQKNGVMNTVIDSYLTGIKINSTDKELLPTKLTTHYNECREFEQLYVTGILPQPHVDDTKILMMQLINSAPQQPIALAKHLGKKIECAFINKNRFFLLPSATYRIGSKIRDYVMIFITQLNPMFRPLIGLIFLLIPGVLPLFTRIVLIGGFFATVFMHTNPEARYFFPFILAGIINVSIYINNFSKNRRFTLKR